MAHDSRVELLEAMKDIQGGAIEERYHKMRSPSYKEGSVFFINRDDEVAFTYDHSEPYVSIPSLGENGYFSEYRPRFQEFRFDKKLRVLVISGQNTHSSQPYTVEISLPRRSR